MSDLWARFWMRRAGRGPLGRLATRLACLATPPYKGRRRLARYSPAGYVAPSAILSHRDVRLRANVFIGNRVVIYQDRTGGSVEVGDRVHLHDDTIIEIGPGGGLKIGEDTHIQPKCQITSYAATIEIGAGVQIAPLCAIYSYDHDFASGQPIRSQALRTKGPVVIGDDAWLGVGAIVLSGVRIGPGAVIGAGAIVTRDVPAGAIALGQPARVVRMRGNLPATNPP